MAEKKVTIEEDSINEEVKFSGLDKKIISNNFKGGKIMVKGGGVQLDLTNTKMQKNGTATLEVEIVGAGIKLIVPSTWIIKAQLQQTASGFHDGTTFPKDKPEGILTITGKIMLGGIEVSNS